jgi:hypothetical protein
MISILFPTTYYTVEARLFYQNDLRHDDNIDQLCKIEESSITTNRPLIEVLTRKDGLSNPWKRA